MSLWEVPDFQTQAFMTEFYTNWLGKEVSIYEAFRAAQLSMRQQFGNVAEWAGFVLLE
jgi:CHAT domain-containing protein